MRWTFRSGESGGVLAGIATQHQQIVRAVVGENSQSLGCESGAIARRQVQLRPGSESLRSPCRALANHVDRPSDVEAQRALKHMKDNHAGTTGEIGMVGGELIAGFDPHLRELHRQGMQRYLRTGEARVVGRRVELEALRADGQPFPIDLAISEVHQAGRRLFTAYVRDITERRRMERVLRESEQYFKTLAEAHPVAICIVRLEDRRILHASQRFAELFGVPHADLPGQDVRRFYLDIKDRDRLIALLREHGAVDGFELQQRRADGTVFPTVLSSRLMEFQGQRAIVSGVLDLTKQKQAEAEVLKAPDAGLMGDGSGILVVDDLVDTGKTLELVRRLYPQAHFATVYAKPQGRAIVDTYITEVSQDTWIFFPWDMALQYVRPYRGE